MQLNENIVTLEAVIVGSRIVQNGYLYEAGFIQGQAETGLQADVHVWMEKTSSAISKAMLNYACFAVPVWSEGHVDLTC